MRARLERTPSHALPERILSHLRLAEPEQVQRTALPLAVYRARRRPQVNQPLGSIRKRT